MRITFVLSCNALSGGHRIIYSLANRLAGNGHKVRIYYPVIPLPMYLRVRSFSDLLGLVRSAQLQLTRRKQNEFDCKVPLLKIPWISQRWIADGDVLVAPQWDLLLTVDRFPARKGVRIHYIHDGYYIFKDWEEKARSAWVKPEFRIVTTRRLQEHARRLGLSSEYVPNGIDLNLFRVTVPPKDREPNIVAMLYANGYRKALEDGFKVLEQVHKVHKNLKVLLFGAAKLKHRLESWMEWKGRVTREELLDIYNQASIFFCPSIYEGWGLPGFESMACGCALVSTEHEGVAEYAENGVSALLAPIRDIKLLTKNLCRLISDDRLRFAISGNGRERVQEFSWPACAERFEKALERAVVNS